MRTTYPKKGLDYTVDHVQLKLVLFTGELHKEFSKLKVKKQISYKMGKKHEEIVRRRG